MVRKVLVLALAVLGAIGSLYGASSYSQSNITGNVKLSIVSSENGLISLPANISAGNVIRGKPVEVPVHIINRLGTSITDVDVTYKGDIKGVTISASNVSWTSSEKGTVKLKVTAADNSVSDERIKRSTLTFLVKWNGGDAKISSNISLKVTEG